MYTIILGVVVRKKKVSNRSLYCVLSRERERERGWKDPNPTHSNLHWHSKLCVSCLWRNSSNWMILAWQVAADKASIVRSFLSTFKIELKIGDESESGWGWETIKSLLTMVHILQSDYVEIGNIQHSNQPLYNHWIHKIEGGIGPWIAGLTTHSLLSV